MKDLIRLLATLALTLTVAVAADPDPISGTWRWFNKQSVAVTPDGRMTASGGGTGTWKFLENKELERKYSFAWTDGLVVDTLTLSRDGKRLTGKSNEGQRISAERVR